MNQADNEMTQPTETNENNASFNGAEMNTDENAATNETAAEPVILKNFK